MKEGNDIQSLIQGYLKNTLSVEEKAVFEKKLETDAQLKEELELAQLANLALARMKLYDVKNIAGQIHQQETKTAKLRGLGLGAGIIVLLTGSYLWYSSIESKNVSEVKSPAQEIKVPENTTASSTENETVNEVKEITSKENLKRKPEISSPIKPNRVEDKLPSQAVDNPDKKAREIVKEEIKPIISEIKTEVKPDLKAPSDPCASVHLEASLFIENACSGESDGRISVSGFKGGKSPYTVKVRDENRAEVMSAGIGKGKYSVELTDHNHCSRTWKDLVIDERECRKDLELNAENGEIAELGEATGPTSLSIVGKDGKVYFYHQYNQGDKINWNGHSAGGEMLRGYFLFQIQDQNGKPRQGSITVIR